MSRIHSGHKGRAGSHRPFPLTKPDWVSATTEEVTSQSVQLAKAGTGPALIGQTLRDSYGVPLSRLVTGKRLTQLLRENGVTPDLPDDLQALLKRVVHLQRHLQAHPKDRSNRRGLTLMESRIRRLARYYRRRHRLPEDWRYSAAGAALQVE
ncbi:MAG TPA: 30S ribosomal protein S15 [Thermoplasmata archaeon]|nr:30S ribosomal protein S15 [Thermoplasmata archaeon]